MDGGGTKRGKYERYGETRQEKSVPQLLSSSPSFVQRDSNLEWEEVTKFEIARDLWRKFAQDLTIDRREFS